MWWFYGGFFGICPADRSTLNTRCICRTERTVAQEEASADALLAALERSVRLRRAAGNEPSMDHRCAPGPAVASISTWADLALCSLLVRGSHVLPKAAFILDACAGVVRDGLL